MPEPEIIAIAGKQFAGKDTLADLLLEHLPEYRKTPIALAIKQTYAERTGLSLEEIERNKAAHRPELILLGREGRTQDANYWLKQVLARPGKKIISDVRLKREYELLREAGALMIRVNAERENRALRGTLVSETDATECDLDDVSDWDVVVANNDSIDDLHRLVHLLLNRIVSPD